MMQVSAMRQRRPESTVYLGEDVQKDLQEYRKTFTIAPSVSALVREAVRRFLEEARANEGTLAPRAWVEVTAPVLARLAAHGVSVHTQTILDALAASEDERGSDVLGFRSSPWTNVSSATPLQEAVLSGTRSLRRFEHRVD